MQSTFLGTQLAIKANPQRKAKLWMTTGFTEALLSCLSAVLH